MKYALAKKAKLVGNVDNGMLWLLNLHDDWIHDQYGDSYIHYGIVYSNRGAFHPLSTSITGYFHDDDTKKWIRIRNGVATFTPNHINDSWKEKIEDFVNISFKTGVYRSYKLDRA
jgi:hypothetical protein